MTNQQAINVMRKYTGDDTISPVVQEAHNMAITALEKQEPMKPMLNFVPSRLDRLFGVKKSGYTCRHCGNACLTREISERNETYYCWHCGQKLDWTSRNALN